MKRTFGIRSFARLGTLVFALVSGCGLGSDGFTTLPGNDVSREQLALADGEGSGSDDRAGRCGRSELGRLEAQLGLSAEQVAKIQEIVTATRESLKALRQEVTAGTLTKEAAHTKAHEIHEAERTQILALLTPEQAAKFAEFRSHKDKPFHLDRLAEALSLTEDQKSQIAAIMASTRQSHDDLHEQVEAGTLSREDARAKMEELRKSEQAAISALLTEEQRALLSTLRDRGGRRHH